MKKELSESNNTFKYLGALLIVVGVAAIFNTIDVISIDKITIGIAGIGLGVYLLLRGFAKRRFIFDETEYIYLSGKYTFNQKYKDINLVKNFTDPTNRSNNLLIFVDENDSISFSSSYFSEALLKNVFLELSVRCKEYIDNNELTIDNELNW
jgi:hypothetical protein